MWNSKVKVGLSEVAVLRAISIYNVRICRQTTHNYSRPTATFALPLVVFRPFSIYRCLVGIFMASAVVTASAQPQTQGRPPIAKPDMLAAPALSLGTNADYQHAVFAVETAMQAGDFASADKACQFLPRRQPRVIWDDSKVPIELRAMFAKQRDDAFLGWGTGMPFTPRLVHSDEATDIRISFEPVLNKPVGASEPLPVIAIFSADAKAPRLDLVIGLKRGSHLRPSTEVDVANDVRYGLGLYLGVADQPISQGVMDRVDRPNGIIPVGGFERVIAEHNFIFIENLHTAIDAKTKVAAGLAKAYINPLKLAPPKAILQAETAHFTIQVANQGTAPMETRLIPGCSCFATTEPVTIPPGESRLIPLDMNTLEYVVPVHKNVVLLTSDPDQPAVSIPVDVDIKARYRFLAPDGETIIVGPDGGEATVYLAVEGEPFTIVGQPTLTGLEGTITFEPWSGSLPDPAIGEKSRPRKGYKFNLDIKPHLAPGQNNVGIVITTTDSTFRRITARLLAQKGIVALPDTVFLGHVSQIEREIDVLLTRPGKPFHVLGLTSTDSAHIKLSQSATKGKLWEHTVRVVFDGKVPVGDYSSTITVRTDDPEQPTITIPFAATVR